MLWNAEAIALEVKLLLPYESKIVGDSSLALIAKYGTVDFEAIGSGSFTDIGGAMETVLSAAHFVMMSTVIVLHYKDLRHRKSDADQQKILSEQCTALLQIIRTRFPEMSEESKVLCQEHLSADQADSSNTSATG